MPLVLHISLHKGHDHVPDMHVDWFPRLQTWFLCWGFLGRCWWGALQNFVPSSQFLPNLCGGHHEHPSPQNSVKITTITTTVFHNLGDILRVDGARVSCRKVMAYSVSVCETTNASIVENRPTGAIHNAPWSFVTSENGVPAGTTRRFRGRGCSSASWSSERRGKWQTSSSSRCCSIFTPKLRTRDRKLWEGERGVDKTLADLSWRR